MDDLAYKILEFFYAGHEKNGFITPHSIKDFIVKHPEYLNISYLYCKRLDRAELLDHQGETGSSPYFRHHYYTSKDTYDKDLGKYGSYDLLVNGFFSIRERFKSLCLPIVVKDANNDEDIGSSFVYDNEAIITARHCIENVTSFKVLDSEGKPVSLEEVCFPENEHLDIALLKTSKNYFKKFPNFTISQKPEGTGTTDEANLIGHLSIVLLGQGKVLDEILTLGYPPIAGFESILIADKSAINSVFLRSSVGELLTQEKKYSDGIEYFLINAKVKGGNSGGPVFDNLGRVVGIVVEIPNDIKNKEQLDKLGYGLVLPSKYIKELLISSRDENSKIIRKKLIDSHGYYTFEKF